MKTLKNMLLTIVMLLCCIAVSAQRFEVDGIYYSILSTEDKTIKVSGHNNETCQDCVSIPETIENNGVVYTVTSIGDEAFLECEYLSSITIPSSVRVIGNYAFDYCSKLTSVTIPNSVTSIGDGAFRHSNLTSVNIPNSVTYIGQQAFYDTAWWNSQGDGLVCKDSWLLGYKGNLSGEIVISKEVTRIANYAFYLCSDLTKVEIPSSVTSIGQHAFDQCSNLTEIEIPNSITSIEDYTFYNCTRLSSVTIPNSVTSIGGCAFYCCSGLTSVTIPNSVTSIDCDAFSYCSGLTSVIIPNSVTNIESSAFSYCSGLVSVTIPNSVTSIGNWAFYSCTALKDVYCHAGNVPSTGATVFNSSNYSNATLHVPAGSLESYKTTSPWSTFGNIVALSPFSGEAEIDGINYKLNGETKQATVIKKSSGEYSGKIVIPASVEHEGTTYSVTSIGSGAFFGCSGLTSVTIGNSVTSIGEYAFYSCSGLTSVTIGNSVTSIGDYAFRYCSGLTSVTIGNSVTSIGSYAFRSCSGLTSVTIPNSVTSIGNDAFSYCSGLTSVTIGNSVTSIGSYAFRSCSGLTSVTIPNSVTSIGGMAFALCSGLTEMRVDANNSKYDSRENSNAIIETLSNTLISGCQTTVIPNSVTSIGGMAFDGCSGLTSVTIPNSVTSIGWGVFRGCSSLTSVTIPNSVTSIGEKAFYDCSGLTSVTIGSGVKDIYSSAFANCAELLDVYCYAEKVPSTWGGVFDGSYPEYATLHVPAGSVDSYNATAPWNGFGNIVAISTEVDGINYDFDAETKQAAVIAKSSGKYSGEVIIPESVVYEGAAYSVTSIGSYAFKECTGLTSVTIPNSVTSIGTFAFRACSGLTSVTIPNSVTSIGTSAFSGCTSLFNITIPSGISKIENYTFEDCISLTRITIPDNITEIGEYAFRGCRKINKLLIGSSVNSIQTNAFEYCSGLTLLVLPKSLRWVSSNAFHGCTNLKTVINFSSETPKRGEIDCGYAGYYAERIANRSDGNMYLDGDFVFNRTNSGNELLAYLGSDSDITLPDWSNNGDESYSISGGIFKNDKTVISITVPKSVIEIGSEAFYGTGWWNNQEDGLLYLDSWIIGYKGQSPKGEIIINEGTTGIANYAFEWCGITSVKIPNSVINIGYGAFYYCKSLSSITCLNPISPTCGNNAFYNVSTSSCQLLVPASAIEAYTTTSPWSTFTNIEALPLTDGEDFENTEEQELKTITYTRTLPNLYWNALYVPFEIPVSEIIDKYEVAYVNNVNSYDHNDDGTIDDMRMEVIKIKSGTLNANYPYLIKARNEEAKNMTITLENTTLFQSVETTIDCSSVFAKHEITGIYNKRYKNELPDGAMAISMAGAWQPIACGSYLNPFRLYMTITARDGSPVKVEPAAMSRIRISVLGEDVETDIEETRSETKNIILDLSGRSVQNPVKGGVYIVNGKKVIF